MPGFRTTDHIFILKSAIEKYFRSGKKLYACFIDFKKAFDSVWHEALFLKMRKLGIGGLFYKTVKNMYASTQVCVKTSRGLTPFFPSKRGVKQGCSLSPLLFNLFLKDLSSVLDAGSNIELFYKKFSRLLYADDLLILSDNPSSLQKKLDALDQYCIKWEISINPDKSKVMIFSKSSKKNGNLFSPKIGNFALEIVDQYKYLGVLFCSNGAFKVAKDYLEKRAARALFGMHKYLSDCCLPISTSFELYSSLVQPIASYGAEVWAPFCLSLNGVFKNSKSVFDCYLDFPGNKLFLRFCKRQLGVHERSVNLAV